MPYARKLAKQMRKELTPRRYRSGDYQMPTTRQERREEIIGTVLAQPHRRGAEKPEDPMLGYAIGRLRKSGLISADQFAAAERITPVLKAADRIMLPMRRGMGVLDLERSGGPSCAPEMRDEEIAGIRESLSHLRHALSRTENGASAMETLILVCIADVDPIRETVLGELRCALNAIHRFYRQ